MAESHGNSVAAWTGVGILLASALLICLGLVLDMSLLWMVGVVGIVVGGIAWVVLEKAGYGERAHVPNEATRAVR